jgi:hypothetical protein
MLFGEQDGDLSGMTRRALSCGLSLSSREHPFQVFSVVEPDFSHAVVALIAGSRQVDGVSLESGKPLDERRMFLQSPLLKRFQADAVGSFENADQFVHGTPSVILAMRRLARRDPIEPHVFEAAGWQRSDAPVGPPVRIEPRGMGIQASTIGGEADGETNMASFREAMSGWTIAGGRSLRFGSRTASRSG